MIGRPYTSRPKGLIGEKFAHTLRSLRPYLMKTFELEVRTGPNQYRKEWKFYYSDGTIETVREK